MACRRPPDGSRPARTAQRRHPVLSRRSPRADEVRRMHSSADGSKLPQPHPSVGWMTRAPRVLITGGTGLLGTALLDTAPEGWEVAGTYWRNRPEGPSGTRFHRLDVRDEPTVVRL